MEFNNLNNDELKQLLGRCKCGCNKFPKRSMSEYCQGHYTRHYPRKPEPFEDRFWSKVKKTETCWIWTGPKNRGGYGHFSKGFRHEGKILAHRAAWIINRGKIKKGLFVCHECDNPSCVRPSHLHLGNQSANMLDAKKRNRIARGERHSQARLTEKKIFEIYRLYSEGMKQVDIANRFDLTGSHVSLIINGKLWKKEFSKNKS